MGNKIINDTDKSATTSADKSATTTCNDPPWAGFTEYLLIVVTILLFFSDFCFCVTRSKVVQNGLNWEYTDNWTPLIDSVTFGGNVFESNFLTSAKGGSSSYNVESYVYGGDDSESEFFNRIGLSSCPGGTNVDDPSKNTKWFYDNGYSPKNKLAGLDCSAFVSACLEVSRRSTGGLADVSVKKGNRNDLVPGDMLDYPGSHVILVLTRPQNGKVDTAESTPPNVVIQRGKLLSSFSSSYGSYSSFPVFTDISPSEGVWVDNPRPEIKVTIKSGSNIIASSIIMRIDGTQVSLPSFSDAKTINISYTPAWDFDRGEHTVYIYAKNQLNLEDDTLHRFNTGAFKFRNVYVYPNPNRNASQSKVYIKCDIADKLHIRIFDIAVTSLLGEKTFNEPTEIVGDKGVYRYNWNVSNIASGVYLCFVKAEKEGWKDIKTIKYIAIIR